MATWVRASVAMKQLQISRPTLKLWKDNGKIQVRKLSDKIYHYNLDSVNNPEAAKETRMNVIYARVSSLKQKEDLNRQITILKEYALKNGYKIEDTFADIGSGMSSERPEFIRLMDQVYKRKIDKVFISFKDRFVRFGFNYFERILSNFGTSFEILDSDEFRDSNTEKELTEDLIAIIHHYSMKVYNSRRKKFNKIKKELEETE